LFYEKLTSTYLDSGCVNYFPDKMLNDFSTYLKGFAANGRKKYLNPYRFAIDFNTPIRDAIKFFMFFTNDDGILDIKYFFECSNSACSSHRIFLESISLNKSEEQLDELIFCDMCSRDYDLSTVIPYIKVYFQLKPDFTIPKEESRIYKSDPNSTIEALEGLPDHLKVESPSSTIPTRSHPDEGDDSAVALETIVSINKETNNGGVISNPVENMLLSVASFLRN
jgi:hypothetical protein